MVLVYDALRRLAHRELRRERPGGTIGTTALVHEAYLRLVDQSRTRLERRAHFFSLAALVMRRVLVDEARKRQAAKRGSGAPPLPLSEVPEPSVGPESGLVALDEALTRLESFDEHLSRVVELRYFGGALPRGCREPQADPQRPRAPNHLVLAGPGSGTGAQAGR
jgi:RNA polymerase sigma factor (TIGR02999 family)